VTRQLKLAGQLVALAAVLGLLALLVWRLTHQHHPPKVGAQAPTFSLRRLGADGRVDLASLRGKPVVLNFWASWCGPCKGEAPVLESAWAKYRSQVQFVGIDFHDVTSDAVQFVNAHSLTFPMVQDGSGDITESRYGITQVPETFVLDRDGRIVLHLPGPVNGSVYRARFERALREAAGS
jgi:cytochrome c biogenesis protein CcmG, thiol:disulfide interchange protein DsbE